MNFGGENLVLTMLTPSLRQTLKFNVCWGICDNAYRCPCCARALVPVMCLNRLHFFEVESEKPCLRQFNQSFIGNFHIHMECSFKRLWWFFSVLNRRPVSIHAGGLISDDRSLDEAVVKGVC